MSSLIMWITFCQETKLDKTGSFLLIKANAFKKVSILVYLETMEKFRKLKKLKRKRKHGFLESAMDLDETRLDRNHSKITILIRWRGD